MITSKDRGGWIGASDVDKVVGNWKTATWMKWWLQKLSINTDHFDNVYTLAGTHFEHRILESLGVPMEMDSQYINEELRLRVNLDGNTEDCNYECKTTNKSIEEFKMPKKYLQQVQVQMFGSGIHKTKIVVYALNSEDYDNFFRPIDPQRRLVVPVAYDPEWIQKVYLPKHLILADCLKRGVIPNEAVV